MPKSKLWAFDAKTFKSVEENNAVVTIPLVVQPIRIPVELLVVPVESRSFGVAVLIAKSGTKSHLCHHLQEISNQSQG